MDTLTVVVHLTGLLLFVPPNGPGGSTHVLMPEPKGLEEHVAQIGYPIPGDQLPKPHCRPTREKRICWVNMEDWSIDIVGAGVSTLSQGAARLPRSATNLSERVKRPVKTRQLGQRPGGRIRSRVTLHSGGITRACALSQWEVHRRYSENPDTLLLANVVEWTIPDVPGDRLVLTRNRLLRGLFARSRTASTDTVFPDPAKPDTIHVFVRQIPRSEAEPTDSVSPATRPPESEPHTSDPPTAYHFTAFYDLLGVDNDEFRPVPRAILSNRTIIHTIDLATGAVIVDTIFGEKPKNRPCPWLQRFDADRSPETLTCMVASGRTGP